MAANSSLVILILQLIFCLTSVSSSSLSERLQSKIAVKVRNAVADLELPEGTKDAFSKQHINIGYYSDSFIELLDSYCTMTQPAIRFNEKEKRILTSNSTRDSFATTKYKAHTQLKYYLKMQEVQCADYFVLYYNLYDTEVNMQNILQHVYNMIMMAYVGKFVFFACLWKLYINLLFLKEISDSTVREVTLVSDLEQYREPLDELVNMCVKQKYISEGYINIYKKQKHPRFFEKLLEATNFNDILHKHLYGNKSPLPLSIDHLFFRNIIYDQPWIEKLISPISHVNIDWNKIHSLFWYEINKVIEPPATRDCIMDPFKNIDFQQRFLDIVRVKLYCFVCLHIFLYQKADDSKCICYHDYFFMIFLPGIVKSISIEDKTLNQVITLYSKTCKPEKKRMGKILNILTNEVNNILKPFKTELVDISNVDVENEVEYGLFLDGIAIEYQIFQKIIETKLNGFSFDLLLFFVNGSNNTKLAVFPKIYYN